MTPYETLKSKPESYRKLIELEKMNEEDSSEENRYALAVCYAELGMNAQEEQRMADADFWCNKQLSFAEALYEQYGREEYGILLGDASDYFSLAASELNQQEDAVDWIKKSISVYQDLAVKHNRSEAWYTTVLSYLSLAGMLSELSREEETEKALKQAKTMLEDCQKRYPDDPLFTEELPMLFEGMSNTLRCE